MTNDSPIEIVSGTEIDIPLNKLKKSPRNVRKVPHTAAAIEALAASISAKKMLQKPVVEPERDGDGGLTGSWLVTIGEGRRLALNLLAKRKSIKTSHPVACVIDTEFDPQEISLDENVTRSAMHPADQFEAFRDLNDRLGWGAEEIGARFGVSAQVVRQRLRLGAVSPQLIGVYREDGLTLDKLMAFAITEDHARQEQVYASLAYNRSAGFIRQALTESKIAADDRRAVFIGVEAYLEAGGALTRDLFTEDRGGWLDDVVLVERLTTEKLAALADDVRAREGWKWAQAAVDFPSAHGLTRTYPRRVERTEDEIARIEAISAEYDAQVEAFADIEDLPPEVEARLKEIEAELEALGEDYAYRPDEVARGGLFVCLAYDGQARIERGFIRPEDLAPEPEPEAEGGEDDAGDGVAAPERETEAEEDDDGLSPLSDRLVAELTAFRTASLRDAMAEQPEVAFLTVVHALALRVFFPAGNASCADIRMASRGLSAEAAGIENGPACQRINSRHETWARQMPEAAEDLWAFVVDLDTDSRLAIFAHCVGLSLDAVQGWQRRPHALAQADALAVRLGLDMSLDWRATGATYFTRVTKARILEAVGEASGAEAAERIVGLKKPEMAAAAETLAAETGWLPRVLRTPSRDADAGSVDVLEGEGSAAEVMAAE